MKLVAYHGQMAGLGEAIGEECRQEVGDFVALLRTNFFAQTGLQPNDDSIRSRYRRSWQRAYEASPTIETVMNGIARGSKEDLESIEFINSFIDLISYRATILRSQPLHIGGCTTVAAVRRDAVVLAQNYDMEAFYSDYALVVDADLEHGRFVLFSFAGVLACAGQTCHGWAIGINFLHASDVVAGGLPHAALVFDVIAARDLTTALGVPTYGERASGAHYLIATTPGLMFSIEASGQRHRVRHRHDGYFAHTNHYLDAELSSLDLLLGASSTESLRARRGSSMIRLARAEQLLAGLLARDGSRDLAADMTELLSDSCGGARGILTCVATGNPLIDPTTVASITFDLTTAKATVRAPLRPSATIVVDLKQ